MTHWMNQAVRRAGLPCADRLDLPEGLDIGEVWTRTMEVCDVSADRVAEAVARAFHLETIAVSDAEPTAARLLPEAVARRHRAIPVRDMNRSLVVAVSDPSDPEMEQDIRFASGRIPELRVAPPALVKDALDRIYGEEATVESFLSGVSADGVAEVELAEDEGPERVDPAEAGAGPVVNLVNMILDEAVQTRASDIHLQPGESKGLVRFRIDGVLRTTARVPHSVLSRVISRIKVMGNLDIADRLRAQDGRVRVRIRERSFDLRISTVPTRKAEKAVVRILDPGASTTLEEVGIPGHDLEQVRSVLRRRDGVFVVTGPTGSGKTTTLYSALREIDTEDVNIMTVEDPVEYELPGLTQIQVEQSQGMTFASALRAILRQDPDVIFVGEIRDAETAEIAAQASLTGHLVLATLHTNDALGTLRRFTDLGLDPGTVAETLRGALAQRLVRRVCGHCRSRVREARTDREEDLAEFFGVAPTVRAVGCAQCSGRGYLGRIPVTEYMRVTPDLVRLLLQGASPPDLLAQARRDGLRTLRESALDRVRAGETTLEEVARVVGEEDEESGSLPPAPPASDPPPPQRRGSSSGKTGLRRPTWGNSLARSWWTTMRRPGGLPGSSSPRKGSRWWRPPVGARRWPCSPGAPGSTCWSWTWRCPCSAGGKC